MTQLLSVIRKSLRKMVTASRKTSAAASALLFILSVTSMLTVFGFRSASGCEVPGRIISAEIDPNKRMHEFRITLKSPDFANVSALKQHLTSATILTRILIAEVSSRARSQCSVIASTSLFPDLRVGVHYNSLADESDKCSNLIKDILADFIPSRESVEKIASSIANAKKLSATHTAGYMMEANNVLNDTLRYIYEKDSAMHALVSVGPVDFETSPSSFLTWLEIQRSSNRMVLTPLVMCKSEDEILNAGPSNGNMPYSNIIAPQALSLALPENQSPSPRLHYIVVVGGDSRPEYAVLRSVATERYCRHENTYSLGMANSFVARTRCLTEVFHNTDTWVALFCDPKDCSSAELAEKVATTIANDPDVVALGSAFAKYSQARGPYLVKLISN